MLKCAVSLWVLALLFAGPVAQTRLGQVEKSPTPLGQVAESPTPVEHKRPLFSRPELAAFLCSALGSGDVAAAVKRLRVPLEPARESKTEETRYFVYEIVRKDRFNEVKYAYQGRPNGGATYAHELSIRQDPEDGVWFENLGEVRDWLQHASLLTQTDSELGIYGYAREAESTFSRAERATEPRFDFRINVNLANAITVRWRTEAQMRNGAGFCSAR